MHYNSSILSYPSTRLQYTPRRLSARRYEAANVLSTRVELVKIDTRAGTEAPISPQGEKMLTATFVPAAASLTSGRFVIFEIDPNGKENTADRTGEQMAREKEGERKERERESAR